MLRVIPVTLLLALAAAGCGTADPDPIVKTVYRDAPVDLEDTDWTPPSG